MTKGKRLAALYCERAALALLIVTALLADGMPMWAVLVGVATAAVCLGAARTAAWRE